MRRGLVVLDRRATATAGVVHAVVAAVVNGCFLGALFRLACKQVRGERFGPADLLGVSDVLPALAVGSVLYWAGCSVGFMMCFFPGLVFASLWMFALAADRGCASAGVAGAWDELADAERAVVRGDGVSPGAGADSGAWGGDFASWGRL